MLLSCCWATALPTPAAAKAVIHPVEIGFSVPRHDTVGLRDPMAARLPLMERCLLLKLALRDSLGASICLTKDGALNSVEWDLRLERGRGERCLEGEWGEREAEWLRGLVCSFWLMGSLLRLWSLDGSRCGASFWGCKADASKSTVSGWEQLWRLFLTSSSWRWQQGISALFESLSPVLSNVPPFLSSSVSSSSSTSPSPLSSSSLSSSSSSSASR